MRPRLCSISRSRRMVISELEYFRANSRTSARPFWLTKSTIARRRSSFSTEVRLFGMVAYDHIRAKKQEQPRNCRSEKQKAAADFADKTLVHHYRFDEVAGAVDVDAVAHSDVVGQELQRHHFHDGQQKLFEVRQREHRDVHGAHGFVAFGGQQDLAL